MGRVVVLNNPMNTREARTYEHSGPFIDFLLEHFPAGFSGPHVALLGLQKLPVEDYDRVVGDGDLLTLAISPAVPAAVFPAAWGIWASVAAAAANAAIATAISYAVNHFFGPNASKPSEPSAIAGLPSASSTYSLSTPTNVARIGQPVPVAYGRNPIVPDLASQPYSWYERNEMYVAVHLCLGQGTFDIHSIRMANTEIADMAPGVVEATVFEPSQHLQTFGVMQNATGLYENVYTSPEVSDQEIYARSGGQYSSSASLWMSGGLAYFYLANPAGSYADSIKDGARPLWAKVSGAGGNDGTYLVGYIAYAGQTDYGHRGHLQSGLSWPLGSGSGVIELTYVEPDSEDPGAPIGPYSASSVGMLTSLLCYDIVYPNGCYGVNDAGSITGFGVALQFTAEPIDEDGNVNGPAQYYYYAETLASNTPQRRTLWHGPVPEARYRVTAFRGSPKSDQAAEQSIVHWTGLKSVLWNTMGDTVYGDTTIIALKVKATEGIASDAINRVVVDCTRKLEGLGATRNPIDAFMDVFTNQRYGGRRPTTELDLHTLVGPTGIGGLRAAWSGETFDAVFDQDSTLWEAAGLTVQMQHAFPTTLGATISIIEDKNHTTPYLSLTEDTIKSISEQYMFTDGEEPDGVEGEYRDPGDGAALYALYPADSVRPESVTLWGCRNYADALAFVTQRWKQLSLRRRILTVEIEAEGNVIPVGAPVSVSHRLLGDDPVLCVTNSVTPKDEFSITLEMHRHVPEVFS